MEVLGQTHANLFVHPKYSAAGTYLASITVDDGAGASVTRQFSITVNNKEPNITVYARFKDQDAIGLPWNSITGVTTNNLKNSAGGATSIGLALQTSWWGVGHALRTKQAKRNCAGRKFWQ